MNTFEEGTGDVGTQAKPQEEQEGQGSSQPVAVVTPEIPGSETPQQVPFSPIIQASLYIPARVIGGYYKEYTDTWKFTYEGQLVELVDPESGFMVSTPTWRDHTYILGVKDILPEDLLWRREHPQVPALVCAESDTGCGCPYQCLQKLAMRCLIMFEYNQTLEQIMIVFKREEKPLHRDLAVSIPYTTTELRQGFKPPEKVIPRYWVMVVPRDFQTRRPSPYRLFRGNYDALSNVLRTSRVENVFVGPAFWSMSF